MDNHIKATSQYRIAAAAPDAVRKLVELFDHNLFDYKRPDYDETSLRVEFVNPLFKALGWDMDNDAHYAPNYRDVLYEGNIETPAGTKRADYVFRHGSERIFFVETKRPSVGILDDKGSAIQLRRYGWNSKRPLSERPLRRLSPRALLSATPS